MRSSQVNQGKGYRTLGSVTEKNRWQNQEITHWAVNLQGKKLGVALVVLSCPVGRGLVFLGLKQT